MDTSQPKGMKPSDFRKKVTFREDSELSTDDTPAPRQRNSGFRSLISQAPPILRRRDPEDGTANLQQGQAGPSNKNVKEITLPDTSDEEYWWDTRSGDSRLRPTYRPMARSTPVEPELLISSDDPENDVRGPIRMDRIEEEATDESSTEVEEQLDRRMSFKVSDTIPPGIFYPSFMGNPESKLRIKLINQSLTAKNDNILHFLSADCECTTPISKLLIDIGKIDKRRLLESKPKKGQIITTLASKFRIFTGILKLKNFEEYTIQDLTTALENLADALKHYEIKTLRISKLHDMTDKITFSNFIDIIKKTLAKCDCTLYICYGTTSIPPDDVHEEILREHHDSLIGGHRGVTKTYRRIREKFFWPGLKQDVTEYIRNCSGCQELKLVRIKNKEPMVITDTPIEPFDKISIDTVGPRPVTTNGNKHILTIQDNLTKYCIAVPIENLKAETIADALARNLIAIYGAPRIILSDRAPELIGKVMQQLAEIFRIKQVSTSGYHPQSNGSLERSHLILTEFIRQYIEKYEDWDKIVPFAVFSYNTSNHESTNFTPYELVFGKLARTPSSFPSNRTETYTSYMSELVTRLNDLRAFATESLIKSKHRSKRLYDRKTRYHDYSCGDWVYVQKEARENKLDKTYVGPYKIVDVLEKNNVVLQTSNNKRILKHVDKIKPSYHSKNNNASSENSD